jgi:uncharacterized membrane protein
MAKKKVVKSSPVQKTKVKEYFVFNKDNYRWMLIGLGVILLGFILMYGQTDELYRSSEALRSGKFSFGTHMKITVAPLVVLAGFVVEIYAIMKRPANVSVDESN